MAEQRLDYPPNEWIDQVVKMSDDHTGDREWLRWQLTRAYEAGKRSDSVTTPEKK